MKSIWKSTVQLPEREALKNDITVEAVVIGGGMAGILTAYLLKEQGVQVVLLEADRIASGQTGNTTAKITSQHGLIYDKLLSKYGKKRAALYGAAHEAAISEYERLIKAGQIACHFERLPAYLYSVCHRKQLEREAEAAEMLGLPAAFLDITELPVENARAVRFDRQAQFHPLEFIKGISGNLDIYEKTKVLSVRGNRVFTGQGEVKAEHIVFASHYPFPIVPGFYFARMHQERSYVVAYENVPRLKGMYYGIDEGSLSLRSYENILLAGGGAHRSGRNETGGRYDSIRQKAEQYFPDGKEIAHWSAQDCMPHDNMAFMGSYSLFRPYWYVETGFQKWGMTASMLSAMIIRDQICGIENPYEKLFSPQRLHPVAAAGGFMQDIGVSIKELSKGAFAPASQEGKVLRCPHMGCRLYWNEDEQSFDCPCHGSRFDKDGRLMDDPAQTDLTKR